MNKRTERARYLGEQLAQAMAALATATRGADAAIFLDRLSRLEGYTADEIGAVDGLALLIREARDARIEHASELGASVGGALDIDSLLHVGRHLPAGDDAGQRDGWLRDVLLVATLLPWLSPPRRMLVRGALAKARAIVESDADGFLPASVLVSDRRSHEDPSVLGEEAGAWLDLLADLPLLVAFDRAESQASGARVDHALREAGSGLVDEADDALTDHHARRNVRLPRADGVLRLAAGTRVGSVVCRVEAGIWVLTGGTLRWEPQGDQGLATVLVFADGNWRAVQPVAGEFPLPNATESLRLRLSVGSDTRVITLGSPGV